ncbi:uncharacterized protein LOC131578886 isoform X1 [Poecile atricapillus]|uniref:uncharacterized protein LOC131578886 isoform X1 n=1 Tax=Poecile atricapillus TaxID=48891 RepID=UPI0027394093|nr:uncharacterized protein LOC131578886 isoform X1 [Poecile atricapillus]
MLWDSAFPRRRQHAFLHCTLISPLQGLVSLHGKANTPLTLPGFCCWFHTDPPDSDAHSCCLTTQIDKLIARDMLLMVFTRSLGRCDSCEQYQQCLGRFGVEITDEEFELLLDRICLDEDGNVKYPQFMLRKLSSISVVEERTSRSVVLVSAAMCLSNSMSEEAQLTLALLLLASQTIPILLQRRSWKSPYSWQYTSTELEEPK